jgi:hypothetical protein
MCDRQQAMLYVNTWRASIQMISCGGDGGGDHGPGGGGSGLKARDTMERLQELGTFLIAACIRYLRVCRLFM